MVVPILGRSVSANKKLGGDFFSKKKTIKDIMCKIIIKASLCTTPNLRGHRERPQLDVGLI